MAENTVAPRFGGLHEEEAGGNGWRKVDEECKCYREYNTTISWWQKVERTFINDTTTLRW